jgi:Glycosyl transferase family 2
MTEPAPLVSVLLIDGSFRESFHAPESFGRQTFPADRFELIWVEHGDRVKPELTALAAARPNFRILTLGRREPYHSAHCRNAGLRVSRGELIVYADGDVAVEEDFLQSVWDEHRKADDLVMFLYRHDEPRHLHRDDWNLEHLRAVGRIENPLNFGACISVRRRWLVEINGWEQHPVFGSEINAHGVDVHARLKNLGLAVKWHPGIRLYHPWHPQSRTSDDAYRLQAAFSAYRARTLGCAAYDGLDPARTTPVPAELEAELDALRRRIEAENRGRFLDPGYYGRLARRTTDEARTRLARALHLLRS